MKKQTLQAAFALPLLLAAFACGTAPVKPEPDAASAAAPANTELTWKDSNLEIVYTLGHSRRKIRMDSAEGTVKGEFSMDRTLLKQSQVEPAHYKDYLAKVAGFLAHQRGLASAQAAVSPECRSPYKIQLRSGKDNQAYAGCRMSDEGTFSKLVKESEFLILSGK